MPLYTPTTWVNGVTATNQTNMNKIETQLAAAPYSTFFHSYQLANNTSITQNNTTTYSCTGGSTGVPSGATGVILSGFFTPSAATTFAAFTPQGTTWTNGDHPMVLAPTTNIASLNSLTAKINASNGQLDVRANNGNVTGFYLWITGYIY